MITSHLTNKLASALGGALLVAGVSYRLMAPRPSLPGEAPEEKTVLVRGSAVIPRGHPEGQDPSRWSVWAIGRIEGWRQAVVGAKTAGRIEIYLRKEGDSVKRGEKLALLERRQESAKLSAAKARWRQASRDLKRARRLRRARVNSKHELEQAQTAYDLANAEAAVAKAALEDRIVRAPFDGQVLKTYHEAGESVSPGAPVLALGDLSFLKVRAEVDELDVAGVEVGTRARVYPDALPGESFDGRVTSVSGILGRKSQLSDDPKEKSDAKVLEVEVRLENYRQLLPGMNVKVEILRKKGEAP